MLDRALKAAVIVLAIAALFFLLISQLVYFGFRAIPIWPGTVIDLTIPPQVAGQIGFNFALIAAILTGMRWVPSVARR